MDTNKEVSIMMPKHANIFSVGVKPNDLNVSIWAIVDIPLKEEEKRTYVLK